jgi:hypothetical protein
VIPRDLGDCEYEGKGWRERSRSISLTLKSASKSEFRAGTFRISMSGFVLDNSLPMRWCVEDDSLYAVRIFDTTGLGKSLDADEALHRLLTRAARNRS